MAADERLMLKLLSSDLMKRPAGLVPSPVQIRPPALTCAYARIQKNSLSELIEKEYSKASKW